ncbi:MAG: thioredoxin [Patescibacteria group bacterium]
MSIILTDENFEKEIQAIGKPVLVDFFATWCEPCSVLTPILEKVADDLKEKIVLVKANIDEIPQTAQKFGIDRIPTIVLFEKGKPISSFVGLRSERDIKEWLEEALNHDQSEKIEELIVGYSKYAEENGFKLNPDKKTVERVIKGLLENEKKYGEKYCPCRRVTGDKEEDSKKICPCFWHKDEINKDGHCFCRLYVK